ncbi:hypothetical protein C8R44DRAFT_950967 [Mycena epipterygia]|nr:hypothetical protein C8R44DRAFT_950967 [Mycena epipterygia]
MNITGNPSDAHHYAQRAQQYAEYLGDILGQARALQTQASCQMALGDFQYAKTLSRSARDLLDNCGLQGGYIDLIAKQDEAEIYFLKTEYCQSRKIHTSIADNVVPGQPETYATTFSRLNIALIDIATSADLDAVHHSLETCKLHFEKSSAHPRVGLQCDMAFADLYLRQGKLLAAKQMFEKCFLSCWNSYMDGAIFCIERLADPSHGMYDIPTAFSWSAVYFGYAMKTKDKLAIMKALRCLGQIFVAQGDDQTGLSVLTVALDGFTFMDVHQWKADCMAQIGEISERNGDIRKAVELWKVARPLFELSSQKRQVSRMDEKLMKAGISLGNMK